MVTRNPRGAEPGPELVPGLIFLVIGLTLPGLAATGGVLPLVLYRLFLEVAAAVLLVAAGFLSTYFADIARLRGRRERVVFVRKGARELPAPFEQIRSGYDSLYTSFANTDWRGDWLPIGTVALGAALALTMLDSAWPLTTSQAPDQRLDEWVGGILVALAFPVLVLERRFDAIPSHVMADAPSLTKLLRLLQLNLLGFATVCLLLWLVLSWAAIVERVVVVFTGLVAVELLLRAATYLFVPLPPFEARRGHGDSFLAGLIRLEWPDIAALNATVNRQFGIDLSRSWALAFIRRSAFQLALGLVVAGWLLTSVTALGVNQRAVYEALGRPQTVFHSGLHIHLPWPFGKLRPVEYGEVHEIPIVFPAAGGTAAEASTAPTSGSIEGPPPLSADRLWDSSHPSEASYLVADYGNGRQSFEIVNIDLRVLYRIGLSNEAAYDTLYNVESPEALIRAVTGRMLAFYFARYTISDVLGQNREAFVRGFQRELRVRLSKLSSGIDILGVVVEAIHPPPDAATAYQNVQAAAVRSITAIAVAQGNATRLIKQTQTSTERMRAGATASAAETVDKAKADTTFFLADVTAYQRDGEAFLFERRLGAIDGALQPGVPVTIIDSRIPPDAMPTLDMLKPGASAVIPETDE